LVKMGVAKLHPRVVRLPPRAKEKKKIGVWSLGVAKSPSMPKEKKNNKFWSLALGGGGCGGVGWFGYHQWPKKKKIESLAIRGGSATK
jgi:hypothetical protein